MSATPSEDESVPHTGGLGLHRGRRVLVGCLLAGLLIFTGQAVMGSLPNSSAPQLSEAVPPVPAVAPSVPRPTAPPKRRSRAARSGAQTSIRAPAPVEREATLSPPPLVAATLEVEPIVAPAPPVQEAPAVAEAPGLEAVQPVAPEPIDDGNGEAIARAIAAEKRSAVQTCFERELKQTPTLNGTLVVELDLAPPHRVNAVRVTDDLERPAFTQCITSTMEHLSFVALNEEVSVRVPYVLSARAK